MEISGSSLKPLLLSATLSFLYNDVTLVTSARISVSDPGDNFTAEAFLAKASPHQCSRFYDQLENQLRADFCQAKRGYKGFESQLMLQC